MHTITICKSKGHHLRAFRYVPHKHWFAVSHSNQFVPAGTLDRGALKDCCCNSWISFIVDHHMYQLHFWKKWTLLLQNLVCSIYRLISVEVLFSLVYVKTWSNNSELSVDVAFHSISYRYFMIWPRFIWLVYLYCHYKLPYNIVQSLSIFQVSHSAKLLHWVIILYMCTLSKHFIRYLD